MICETNSLYNSRWKNPTATSRSSAAFIAGDGELANQTQSQHAILYLRLSDLAEQAEELQYRGVEPRRFRELVSSSCQFHSDLREHERMENELIRRSYEVG